jgi:hypothetical protein
MSETVELRKLYEDVERRVTIGDIWELCESLERERDEARAALSGRTVSCSQCNELARENAEMKATLHLICESQQRILALSDKLLEQNLK